MATKKQLTDVESIEALESDVQEKIIDIDLGDEKLTLIQKPLSFFGKIEFFSVMGKAVQKILSDGGSLTDIFDAGEFDPRKPFTEDLAGEADIFINAISKIVENAPEILLDLYVVILRVPKGQREYIKEVLEEQLDDEQGMAIFETFIDQNYEILTNFFKERVLPMVEKISQKFRESDQSKP